jgi:hypothetical protein
MKTLFATACFAFLLLNGTRTSIIWLIAHHFIDLLLQSKLLCFARCPAAAGVESRKCHCDDDDDDSGGDDASSYQLFVFGDYFADTGNIQKSDLKLETRAWYEPFGMSDAAHDNNPTGRMSDGMVQSDFLGTCVYPLLHCILASDGSMHL